MAANPSSAEAIVQLSNIKLHADAILFLSSQVGREGTVDQTPGNPPAVHPRVDALV